MKIEHLFEYQKLSKIDVAYEWVLFNACTQDTGQDKKPKTLWIAYQDGKIRGKRFFEVNLNLIKDCLYWSRHNYDHLNITEDSIDFAGERIHLNINSRSGPPPMKLKGIESLDIVLPNIASLPDWLPERCGYIGFESCPNLTFAGAGTSIKECKSIIIRRPVDLGFKGGFLSLFKIKNLERFNYSQDAVNRQRQQFMDLIYEPLKSGDVFACQEILESNGFKEQAKL